MYGCVECVCVPECVKYVKFPNGNIVSVFQESFMKTYYKRIMYNK